MNETTLPQPLLTPGRMGDLVLPNRIVMAPLTRMRAANAGHIPTALQARYYAQRASAGVRATRSSMKRDLHHRARTTPARTVIGRCTNCLGENTWR